MIHLHHSREPEPRHSSDQEFGLLGKGKEEKMRLKPKALFLASGIVAAVSYVICALAVAVAPDPTARFFSYVFHIDLTGLSRSISWGGFFGGVLSFSIVSAALVGLTAWTYNRLATK
jgi:hypothetical protein